VSWLCSKAYERQFGRSTAFSDNKQMTSGLTQLPYRLAHTYAQLWWPQHASRREASVNRHTVRRHGLDFLLEVQEKYDSQLPGKNSFSDSLQTASLWTRSLHNWKSWGGDWKLSVQLDINQSQYDKVSK